MGVGQPDPGEMKKLMQQDPMVLASRKFGIQHNASRTQKRTGMYRSSALRRIVRQEFAAPGRKPGQIRNRDRSTKKRAAAYFLKNSGFSIFTTIFFWSS